MSEPPQNGAVPSAVPSADPDDASASAAIAAPSPPSSPGSNSSASLASHSHTTVDTDKAPETSAALPPNGNAKLASSPAPDSTPHQQPPPPPTSKPPSVAAAERKPKSTKARKSRSPSPVPPPPPPLQTVRLDITLGGPENYDVDITDLAKRTGQRNPTPPPLKRDTSDSEDDSEREGKPGPEKGKGKSKKRNADYDLNDPFIDDSELAIDDRTHFAQTKQQGFYVSSGEVALLKDKSPKKPRSKHPLLMNTPLPVAASHAASQSTTHPPTPTRLSVPLEGTRESPIALLDDDEAKPTTAVLLGTKRSASSASSTAAIAVEPSKKKRRTDLQPLHHDLERSIEELKIDIDKASFQVKGKFPPTLKPLLTKLAVQAIMLGEYNDAFFSKMPQIFPYNRFTMMKLIKRLVYPDHQKLLQDRQDELLVKLKDLADKGFDQAKAEWERNVLHWKERVGRYESEISTSKALSASAEPSANGDDNPESPAPNEPKDSSKTLNRKLEELQEKEPPKKYRLTEEMKKIFWELYCLSNECSRLTNEKNQLEGVGEQVSEQGMRKGLYQKIIGVFPEGWMTSGNISRDISVIKKKMETDPSRYEDYTG